MKNNIISLLSRGYILGLLSLGLVSSVFAFIWFVPSAPSHNLNLVGGVAFSSVSAKDVYVAQTSSGLANGSDCANAYDLSFVNTTSNWATPKTAGKIGPGDTIHLCGTITTLAGSAGLVVNGSGTEAEPITILFESGAVLQSDYFGGSSACYSLSTCNAGIEIYDHNYIIVDGGSNGIIQNTANGTDLSNQQKSAGIALKGDNIIVRNLNIRNIYQNNPLTGTDVGGQQTTNIKVAAGSTDVSICNNNLDGARSGISSDTSSTEMISYPLPNCSTNSFSSGVNYFDNVFTDHAWHIQPSGINNSVVNIFDNDFGSVANWVYTANESSYYHTDGVIAWGNGSGQKIIVNLFNNYFHDALYGTAAFYCTYGTAGSGCASYVYNNVFDYPVDATRHTAVWLNGSAGYPLGPNYLYNNTFVNVGYVLQVAGDNAPVTVKNNIATIGSGSYFITKGYGTDSLLNVLESSDYNNFYGGRGLSFSSVGTYWGWPTGGTLWTSTGFDTHSVSTNPSLGANYQLSDGSSAIGGGENLSALCSSSDLEPLCFDKAGVSRPTTGSWDIGAFEYGSSVPVEAPCTPSWSCSSWSVCSSSSSQARTCADSNSCGVNTNKPAESQSCVYVAPVPEVTPVPVVTPVHRGSRGGSSGSKTKTTKSLDVTSTAVMTETLPSLLGPFAPGMQTEQVKVLQQYLSRDTSIYPEAIVDGYYSDTVTKAVQRFQAKYGLASFGDPYTTAYGLAGPATRAKITEVLGATNSTTDSVKTTIISALKKQITELLTLLNSMLQSQISGQ